MADPNPILAGRMPGATTNTQLDSGQEQFYRMWVAGNNVPTNPDATGPQDYDMRGFYQGLQQGNPKAVSAVDPNDNQTHYPDYWKTPTHQTFSNESQWAPAAAPQWNSSDQLVKNNGQILFNDQANNGVDPNSLTALVNALKGN